MQSFYSSHSAAKIHANDIQTHNKGGSVNREAARCIFFVDRSFFNRVEEEEDGVGEIGCEINKKEAKTFIHTCVQ